MKITPSPSPRNSGIYVCVLNILIFRLNGLTKSLMKGTKRRGVLAKRWKAMGTWEDSSGHSPGFGQEERPMDIMRSLTQGKPGPTL